MHAKWKSSVVASRRRDADAGEDLIFPQVMVEIVEAVRTILADVLVPQIWKNSSTEVRLTSATDRLLSSYEGHSSCH